MMKRGDIYFADLDPTQGSETQKKRPVLIVSNNASNKGSTKLLTIVPLTSNTSKVFPFDVFLSKAETGLSKDSKVMCNQVRTISRARIVSGRIGSLLSMQDINLALSIHLDLL